MRRAVLIAMITLGWMTAAHSAGSGSGGGGGSTPADGLIQFDPPQVVGCIAVRVDVPEDKMVTGLRWYNGSGQQAFPKVLVASGNDFAPPAYSQAVAVAVDVLGLDQAWSEVVFTDPVASQSGTLFIVMEYPENYTPQPGLSALGVGYALEASTRHYFVTGDGEKWIKVTSRCRVLLEPVLADRVPGVVALRGPQEGKSPDAAERMGLFAAPNPFNPETRIDLYLPAPTTGDVKIVDVRGFVVAELHHGALVKGQNTFVWHGRDRGGRAAASGVYWVLAQTNDQKLVKKLLLVK